MSEQLPPPPGEDPEPFDPAPEEPKRHRVWPRVLGLCVIVFMAIPAAALLLPSGSSTPAPSPTPPPIIFHTVRIDGENMAEVFAQMAPCTPVAAFRSGDGMTPHQLDQAIAAQIHAYGVQSVEDIHSAIHVVDGHTYWVVAGVACH